MSIVAVLPVKALASAKSRLTGVLSQEERGKLVLAMMDRLLRVLGTSQLITSSLVVSPDPRVLKHAAAAGARILMQQSPSLSSPHNEGAPNRKNGNHGFQLAGDQEVRSLLHRGSRALLQTHLDHYAGACPTDESYRLRDSWNGWRSSVDSYELVANGFNHHHPATAITGSPGMATSGSGLADPVSGKQRSQLDGLNAALVAARQHLGDATAMLVLLADLPLLTAADIAALCERLPPGGPAAVIAPDRHERGTNALLLRPPQVLPFCFGADSLARHINAARQAQLPLTFYRSPGTAFDLDTVADLHELEDFWKCAWTKMFPWQAR